ncbi:head GIN domain-containing protein [Chloroflexota bacterium]
MRKVTARIILTGILIAPILLLGCARTVPIPRLIKGSGKVVTQEMKFMDFTYVEAGSVFEVEIQESSSYLTAITANENLFDYIKVSQEGETLKIRLTPTYNYSGLTLKAKITMPKLSGVRLHGATKGTIKGFQSSNDFDLELSGASSLDLDMEAGDTKFEMSGATKIVGTLEARDTEFRVSEASIVELEGSADKMTLSASGASKLKLVDFPVEQAIVTLGGASEATIQASRRLDVILTGASKLYYKGDPMIGDIMISDTSEIKRK